MSWLGAVPPTLERYFPDVELALRNHLEQVSANKLPLYTMMQYQLGWVDRDGSDTPPTFDSRVYGALVLLAANSVSSNTAYFGNAAAAIELFHESVTVHEQMQTGDLGRDGLVPVWSIWGPAQAINVGDGLHALARLAVLKCQMLGLTANGTIDSIAVLDELALRYYEGQYLELTYQERVDITTFQYSTLARSKTGALLGGALALGAMVGGASPLALSTFKQLGSSLGELVQIRDDIEAIWSDTQPQGRVLNKSKLFPVVHILENGSLPDKRALGGVYFKRVMEETDLQVIRQILDGTDARVRSEDRKNSLLLEAQRLLTELPLARQQFNQWQDVVTELS